MRRRRQKRGASVLVVSFTVSAVVHLLLGFPLKRWVEAHLNSGKQDAKVKVVRLSPEQWSRNFQTNKTRKRRPESKSKPKTRAQAAAEKKAAADKAAAEKKKQERVKPDGQIVNVAPTADDTPNPDAKYLSKYNTNVKKETVARLDARDHKRRRVTNRLQKKSQPAAPPKSALKTRGLTIKGDGLKKDLPGKPGDEKFVLKMPDILRRDAVRLGLGLSDDPYAVANRSATDGLLGNSDRFELSLGGAPGKSGEQGGKKGAKNGAKTEQPLLTLSALVPTLGRAGRLAGSPSMDHVEGVQEGDGTFLNTKEFKYATFYHRVSDSVYPYWDSYLHTEYRRRDPTRRIYGQKDRSTVVRVELNLSGEVEQLNVQESSGVDFLDDVILRAIRKAGPFPNPPAALADEDGKIQISYRFVVVLRPSRGNLFRGLR